MEPPKRARTKKAAPAEPHAKKAKTKKGAPTEPRAKKARTKKKDELPLEQLELPEQLETLLTHYNAVDMIACTLIQAKIPLSLEALTHAVTDQTRGQVDGERVIRQAWAAAPRVIALEHRPVLAADQCAAQGVRYQSFWTLTANC